MPLCMTVYLQGSVPSSVTVWGQGAGGGGPIGEGGGGKSVVCDLCVAGLKGTLTSGGKPAIYHVSSF